MGLWITQKHDCGPTLGDTNSLPKGKIEALQADCARRGVPLSSLSIRCAQRRAHTNITLNCPIFFKSKCESISSWMHLGHIEFIKNMVTGARMMKQLCWSSMRMKVCAKILAACYCSVCRASIVIGLSTKWTGWIRPSCFLRGSRRNTMHSSKRWVSRLLQLPC